MIRRLLSLTHPVVIAHRGGSKLNPENTMAAFDHAVALGVDGLECDVHLSRDGEPVVIHDPTLDRTTDQKGPVNAFTAEELGRAAVPRLSTLLGRHAHLPVVVELKGSDPRIVGPVLDVIRACGAEERVMFGGFDL